jgi:hypothetical protein
MTIGHPKGTVLLDASDFDKKGKNRQPITKKEEISERVKHLLSFKKFV